MLNKGDRMLAGLIDKDGTLTAKRLPVTILEVRSSPQGQSARVRCDRRSHRGQPVCLWVSDRFLFPQVLQDTEA